MHEREAKSRVNYFDGQRVTEQDLNADQSYFRDNISGIVHDSGNFGVIDKKDEKDYVLLDINEISSSNLSYDIVNSGKYDGKIIRLDKQPSNLAYGNRIEVLLKDTESVGRFSTKIIVVGRVFNSMEESGSLTYEILDFKKNYKQITKNYFVEIYGISINNYSGGNLIYQSGSSSSSVENQVASSNIIISEAKPLEVFADTINFSQTQVPSHDAYHFGTIYQNFQEFLTNTISQNRSASEIYYDFEYDYEQLSAGDNISNAVGQKFLSSTNNIQSIDVLLSLSNSGDWSGDLVFSIKKLSSSSNSRVASDPIGFDPDERPIAQVALDKQDLEDRGIFLSTSPTKVSIDFSRFECAYPDSEKIVKNEYFAFTIERVGDNRVNDIRIYKGFYVPSGKNTKNISLNPLESFSKQNYKLFKFDGDNEKYIDYSDESLWISVNTSAIEVTPGSAYSEDGYYLNIPYAIPFVGSTYINNYKNSIDIPSFNSKLYVVLEREEIFGDMDVHPRTGDFVNTRIADKVKISFKSPPIDINENIILASVHDKNLREKISITGSFDSAGLYENNYFYILRPSSSQKNINYVGMNFIPDTDCQCNNEYQIISYELNTLRMGDLDRDGEYTLNDSAIIASIAGNTINSEVTERRLFGGEISIVDFYLSDLNNDQSIDGFDVLKSENAAAGSIDFDSGETLEYLKIRFQNLRNQSSPFSFEGSFTSSASTNIIQIVCNNEQEALIIRSGDLALLTSTESYTDLYVKTKEILSDGVTVNLGLETVDGEDPLFVGASGSISISSRSQTNALSDNKNLVQTPYTAKNYKIYVDETEFRKINIDVCDLRSFINYNRRKEYDSSCDCVGSHTCERAPVTEHVVNGDLAVEGLILDKNGIPYRADIDYAHIKFPLPAGSIESCSIDLYETFMKASGNSCFTSKGLPAMKFADGTYVGCQDTEGNTDIDKNRVKFMYGIASIYADIDQPNTSPSSPNKSVTMSAVDYFDEDFIEKKYTDFSSFTDMLSSSNAKIAKPTGASSNPIKMKIAPTSTDEYAIAIGDAGTNVSDDFTIDFKGLRKLWSTTSTGEIRSYAEVKILNSDSTYGEFRVGYLQDSSNLYVFSQIINYDSGNNEIENKLFKRVLSENLEDVTNFRIRRVNDSIKAYYFIDDNLTEGSVLGIYERIDENPQKQIGLGDGKFRFVLESDLATYSSDCETHFELLKIKSEYQSAQFEGDFTISRNSSDLSSQATFNFILPLSSKDKDSLDSSNTKIILTPNESKTGIFNFTLTGLKLVNARNFDTVNNYFEIDGFSYPVTIQNPVAGQQYEIDITQGIKRFLNLSNFVSGSYKAMTLKVTDGNTGSLEFRNNIEIRVTYNDGNQNIPYKVGLNLDTSNGIITIRSQNILYDGLIKENRTVVSVGVLLKKSGFVNKDYEIDAETIKNIGLGDCIPTEDADVAEQTAYCNTIAGPALAGISVAGPYPCEETGPRSGQYGTTVVYYA